MEEKRPVTPIISIIFIICLVLIGRLFQLQVIEGKENLRLSESNRVQKVVIEAPRGLILDRNGEILAKNEPRYLYQDKEVDRDTALKLQEDNKESELKIKLVRKYPYVGYFSHLLGYLGEVSEQEFKDNKLELKGYLLGGLIGKSGVEAEYEEKLKGHDGSEMIEVDTTGETIRRMGKILPNPGQALTLAIDKKMQDIAAKEMLGKKGAVVATNPKTGEVLLFYSSPSFDNNLFLDKKRNKELVGIINDENNQPLLDRVISGLYQPGSTFKIVTTIAGLEEGKITSSTLINDPGVIILGSYKYNNWYFTGYGRTEGEINVVRALARSTDTFFYKLGEMVGIEKLNYWANEFKVTNKSGIDLPGEILGFMATPEWKQKEKGENWFLGNTYHISIGQGDIDLTPLSVNLMTQAVANEGKICTPKVLKIGAENTLYKSECRDLKVKKEYWQVVKKGMIGACSNGGTAYPFFTFVPKGLPADWRVACKTGTAETGDGKTTHAWFTVFAPACAESSGEAKPACDPEIVLTVLVEKGGEGSSVAAPIAKEILSEYFKER